MTEFDVEQVFGTAIDHHKAGRHQQAQELYQQILARQPRHAAALHYLGVIAYQTGRLELAVELIGQAVALRPDYPEACSNLGNALRDQGNSDAAITACRRAIELRPDYAQAHNNLGNALRDRGQLNEATAEYRRAIELKPDYAEAYSNLGVALAAGGQADAAIAAYQRAIALRPGYPEAFNNLGNVLKDMGQLDPAVAAYRQALANKPDYAQAHSNLVLISHYHPKYDARHIFEECRRWNQKHAAPLESSITPHTNDRNPDRRLRVGYVSADFCQHASANFLIPLLEHHDPQQVEIFGYAHVLVPDVFTSRMQRVAAWRNIVGMSDEQVADRVREDHIDILVDLKLHTAQNRLLCFARKPAPVQVAWLGYPGSTGMSAMDYRLTDQYLDPPEVNPQLYSEKSVRLADCFWCYDPLNNVAINPLPAKIAGEVTFGCLNNFCKVNQSVLGAWAAILKSCPKSRIMILAPAGEHRRRTAMALEVDPDRVQFVDYCPRDQYFKRYHRIDLVLDTFPYNGHTTTCDALWMGVPVISMAGKTAVGRGGLSLLSNIGLPELVADSPQQYERLATEMAFDLKRLTEMRSTLRQRMLHSPLMDAARFARSMELAYRQMWKTWCAEPD